MLYLDAYLRQRSINKDVSYLTLIPVLRSPFPLYIYNARAEQLEMVFLGTYLCAITIFTMALFLTN